jgi:hypothetical protein
MAMPSKAYDPKNYGRDHEMIPEGLHQFEIIGGQVVYGRDLSERWEMTLQPTIEAYQKKNGYKVWLNVDGCVNAIFDAAGADPRLVKEMEYRPEMFVGKKVMAEIMHKQDKAEANKLWANIKRLHPAFSFNSASATVAPAPVAPANDPFPEDEVPF